MSCEICNSQAAVFCTECGSFVCLDCVIDPDCDMPPVCLDCEENGANE